MDKNPEQGDAPAQPAVVQPLLKKQPSAPQDGAQPVVQPSNIKIKPGVIIAIASAVAVVVAAVLVVFLVVLPMFSVSKEDYETAYELTSDVSSECSSMGGGTYSYTSGSATTMKNKLAEAKKSLKACDEVVQKLSEAKAVKRDGEAKELYDAFNEKYADYKKATDIVVEAGESIFLPIAEVDKGSSTSVDAMIKYASELKDKLSKVGNLKNEENKKVLANLKKAADSLETAYKKYKTAYDAYKADYRNNSYPSYTSAGVYDAQDEWSDATKDWTTAINKLGNDSEPSKPLSELRSYLNEKESE